MLLDFGIYKIENKLKKENMKYKRSKCYNGILKNRRFIRGRDFRM